MVNLNKLILMLYFRGRAVTNVGRTCGPTLLHTCICRVAIKYVKTIEQTKMGYSPKCYIPNFVEIRPLDPEKILKVSPYVGMLAILVM